MREGGDPKRDTTVALRFLSGDAVHTLRSPHSILIITCDVALTVRRHRRFGAPGETLSSDAMRTTQEFAMPEMLAADSLRRRLELSLVCAVLLVGALGTLGTFLVVRGLETASDPGLSYAASPLAQPAVHATATTRLSSAIPKEPIVEIWSPGSGARPDITSHTDVVLPRAKPGFTTMRSAGRQWDVLAFGTRNDFVQIAEPHGARAREAARLTFLGLAPLFALLSMLAVTIAILARRNLHAIDRLGRRVAEIDPGDPKPLDCAVTPAELRPFLGSIDQMPKRRSVCGEAERIFVANAAHALRTPVAAIQLQVANLHDAPVEQHSERLEELQRGIIRVASLTTQLLGLAHADTGPAAKALADVSLPRAVSDVIGELLPLAILRGVDLGAVALQPVVVPAAEDDLQILLKNVIDNAIRYSPAGARVDIGVYRQGDVAVVEIVDDGPGIPEAELERMFERFQRGAAAREPGSGLGLSIAKAVAANYGGHVTLSNRVDETTGVVARIELPLRP